MHSRDDVQLVLRTLKENNKIARATHNMYAYRIVADDTRHVLVCARPRQYICRIAV